MPPPKFLTRIALVGFGPRLLPPGQLRPGLLLPRLPPPQIGSGRGLGMPKVGFGHGVDVPGDHLVRSAQSLRVVGAAEFFNAWIPKVGFQAQRAFYHARGSLAGSWDAKGGIASRTIASRTVASQTTASQTVASQTIASQITASPDWLGQGGWRGKAGLVLAEWIGLSKVDCGKWIGSGRMDWLGAR